MPPSLAQRLESALRHRQNTRVRALVEAGVSPAARDWAGRTPLHYARTRPSVEALLSAGADPSALDTAGISPLGAALRRGDGGAALALLAVSAAASARDYPAHWAARQGLVEVLAAGLAAGWSAQAVDPIGRTPLHVLLRLSPRLPLRAPEVLSELERAGARWDVADRAGRTPEDAWRSARLRGQGRWARSWHGVVSVVRRHLALARHAPWHRLEAARAAPALRVGYTGQTPTLTPSA